jgi:hypothetical protein
LHRGDPAEALRWCERARSIERPTNNWSELAVTETIAASAHAASGNDDAALDAADEAIALTGRSSYLWTRVPALTVQLLCACRREDAEHARAVLTDIAAVGGPGVARPWVQLVNHRLDAVPPPTEPWVAPAVVHTDTRDIRLLTVASLWAQLQRDRGSSEPVPLLTAAARAGVRCTFGWPFEVRLLTAGQT